jgi:tetratricopeptide (TPR) repeat protein
MLAIRSVLYEMCLSRIENIKTQLSSLYREQETKSSPGADSGKKNKKEAGSSVQAPSIEDLFSQQNGSFALRQQLIQFQKKAAEAGNSLFWSLNTLTERIKLSKSIFTILNELIDNVSENSTFIPLHMKALLSQNIGIIYYEEYHDKVPHSAYLEEAKQHISSSLTLFQQHFSNSNDSSTQLEHLHSIQLLAAIFCLQKDYSHGISYWKQAIEKAISNSGGLTVGLHYEKLAIVYYNAAICYQEGNEKLTSISLLKSSKSILLQVLNDKKEFYEKQKNIEKETPSLSSLTSSFSSENTIASSSEALQSQPIQDIENLLTAVNHYLQETEAMISSVKEEQLLQQQRQPKEAENLMKMIRQSDGTIKYVKSEPLVEPSSKEPADNVDEYEWEECADFEIDGCETFDVIDERTPTAFSPPRIEKKSSNPVSPTALTAANPDKNAAPVVDDESHLYEGLSEEDRLELMEVRKRYARVTAQQNVMETERIVVDIESKQERHQSTSVGTSDSSKIIALLEEKTVLIKEIEELKRENQKFKARWVSVLPLSGILLSVICL